MTVKTWWRVLVVCIALGCGGPAEGQRGGRAATSGATGDEATESERSEPADGQDRSALSAPMREVLEAHDRLRAEHCAPPLAWSEELAEVARAWAAELASRGCPLQHSQNNYGENLFMATAGSRSPSDVVAVWVDERAAYRFGRGGFSMDTGHFTQVAWIGTERVGCASLACDGMDLWVCNYDPPGNVEGQYQENVLPTTCH